MKRSLLALISCYGLWRFWRHLISEDWMVNP